MSTIATISSSSVNPEERVARDGGGAGRLVMMDENAGTVAAMMVNRIGRNIRACSSRQKASVAI
jgi:hypothetical protein